MNSSRDNTSEDIQTVELAEVKGEDVQLLVDVIYNGLVEATMDELRSLIVLARNLYISIPISQEMLASLDLQLPALPPIKMTVPGARKRPQEHQAHPGASLLNRPPPQTIRPMSNGPPPLKRFKPEEPQNLASKLSLPPGMTVVKNPSKPAPPSMTARPPPSVLQESMKQHQQMTQNGVEVFLCPICNSKYHNLANYRQHMKFHENESLKEERNAMMNAMVSSCYGMLSEIFHDLTYFKLSFFSDPNSSRYTCEICRSFYTHPGNFKQHLGKHERETGAVTALFAEKQANGTINAHFANSVALAPKHPPTAPVAAATSILNQVLGAQKPSRQPSPVLNALPTVNNITNNHLSSVLQSALADRVDNGDVVNRAQYTCDICFRSFKHPGNFKQHMTSHMRTNYSRASGAFGGGGSLTSFPPLASSAPKKLPLNKCDICDQIFDSAALVQTHKREVHGISLFSQSPSPILGGVDPLEYSGTLPSGEANGATSCEVPACYQNFDTPEELQKHKYHAHGVVVYHPELQKHVKIFQCEICSKRFMKHSKLTAHFKIHR